MRTWMRKHKGLVALLLVLTVLVVAGCIYEADRDASNMTWRVLDKVVREGAAPSDGDVIFAAGLAKKTCEKLGSPVTEEPLTAAAAERVTTRVDEGIERDAYWGAKVQGWTTALAGLVGLGGVVGAAWQTRRKAKESGKLGTMIESANRTKANILGAVKAFTEKKEDGKITFAEVLALGMELRDSVGETIKDVSAMRGNMAEIFADYEAARKAQG